MAQLGFGLRPLGCRVELAEATLALCLSLLEPAPKRRARDPRRLGHYAAMRAATKSLDDGRRDLEGEAIGAPDLPSGVGVAALGAPADLAPARRARRGIRAAGHWRSSAVRPLRRS